MGVLSYLGILVLVPLLTQSAKQSPYARFHANQGLILFLAQIAWNIIRTIILTVMVNVVYSYGVYHLCNILFTLLSIALGVFSLIGLIFAAQGKARELPVIGKLHLLK